GSLLSYLARAKSGIELVTRFNASADNMTDKLAALSILAHQFPGHSSTVTALADFRDVYADEPVVLDKWLSVQATVPNEETLNEIKALAETPIFTWNNPNRIRALLGAFATANPVGFNRPDGAAYAYFCESILRLDAINPQVSARLMTAMRSWKDLEPVRKAAAEKQLRELHNRTGLSRDLRDILSRTLGETKAN
ncbi:MAG: aminopeptidase N C-terminal domain-containing protein, partial [Pseudomonadota bacterium]